GGLAVRRMARPSDQTNSPHPSSREGHHSTAGWSSSVLLSQLILNISHCVYRISNSAWTRRTDGIHDRCFNTLPRDYILDTDGTGDFRMRAVRSYRENGQLY